MKSIGLIVIAVIALILIEGLTFDHNKDMARNEAVKHGMIDPTVQYAPLNICSTDDLAGFVVTGKTADGVNRRWLVCVNSIYAYTWPFLLAPMEYGL